MMNYISTRDKKAVRTASSAILQGLSAEGGLFVPETVPTLSDEELSRCCALDYCARARLVLGKFLGNFSGEEIFDCVSGAYTGGRFENDLPAPISKLDDSTYVLELWHGPTCAFKDMALQILPRLLSVSAKKNRQEGEVVILVATSGDTGKAALEGFRDVPGTRILVFYPEDGVSEIQKLQMRTQEGENVGVCAVRGNFDDCQSGVKEIFTDPSLAQRLERAGKRFSSANSINWGRLLPQIVYYVSAYCDLVQNEEIALGDEINVAVPTGNFGNILAAYYAKRMGVPIGKLICASNRNNVLTDFFASGVYDRNRDFFATLSPSMDILISSNLERLLFELGGRDGEQVCALMAALQSEGRYTVPPQMKARMQDEFFAGCCSDEKTKATIRSVFEQYCYLIDTHTAVAFDVCEQYRRSIPDERKTLIVSTASAYKFADSVCGALGLEAEGEDLFVPADALCRHTGVAVPQPIAALRGKTVRFSRSCERGGMAGFVCETLGI